MALSGPWISELFPNVANHADELCLLRSMQTDLPAHPQAFLQMHTGSFQFVRPSLGAWSLYGLGSENENLPGFVTLTPPAASGGAQNYGSSFSPRSIKARASAPIIARSSAPKSATSTPRSARRCNAPNSTCCRILTARLCGSTRPIPTSRE